MTWNRNWVWPTRVYKSVVTLLTTYEWHVCFLTTLPFLSFLTTLRYNGRTPVTSNSVKRAHALCVPGRTYVSMLVYIITCMSVCVPVPKCPRTYVTPYQDLCVSVPMCLRAYVTPYLCVSVPMWPRTYVSPYLCDPVPMSPCLCVPVPMCPRT